MKSTKALTTETHFPTGVSLVEKKVKPDVRKGRDGRSGGGEANCGPAAPPSANGVVPPAPPAGVGGRGGPFGGQAGPFHPDAPTGEGGVWRVADLFVLLDPFDPILLPADRWQVAADAFADVRDELRRAGYAGPPPQTFDPRPALAAGLLDFLKVTAVPAEFGPPADPDERMIDLITEDEFALLEAWARPSAPAPAARRSDPAADCQAWIDAARPRDSFDGAYAAGTVGPSHKTARATRPSERDVTATGEDAEPEVKFDRYHIEAELGRGGFAVVYRANDPLLGVTVALKVFEPSGDAAPSRQAWRRDAQMLYSLQHPNIAKFEAVGEWRGRPYIATEWVRGWTLAEELARRPFAAGGLCGAGLVRAARLAHAVAEGVGFAHAQQVVHRDLKPRNVILCRTPRLLKVIDFGLAVSESRTDGDELLAGAGTPGYMAPEQYAAGGPITPRTDVYAIGVMLYEMLSGRPLFSGRTADEIRSWVLDPAAKPPTPESARPQAAALGRIALKCLEKNPANRYPSAVPLARELAAWLRAAEAARPPSDE